MSSLRTMVDRLDEGDSFTYALVAIAALGQSVADLAEAEPSTLRFVPSDSVTEGSTDEDIFVMALLGLHALSGCVQQLQPAASSEEESQRMVAPGPRELLR